MQTRARLLANLGDAIDTCEALFQEHGEECECDFCSLVSNLVGSLKVFRMLLEIT
jgi:hypothetical protein